MDASTNQMVDQQMPVYDLPSKILCRVVNVDLKVEPDTDEVFAQITLFPESNQDEKNAEKEPLSLLPPRPHVHSFCKTLTASDTSTHGGFSVLRRHADDCLPPLVIAEGLSEEEIAGLRKMFMAMDTDNSGAISFDELKAGLRRYGSTLKDTEIRDLMDAADVDNSGTIDYGEFIAATVHLNKLEREEHLVAGFSCFDKDRSGYITVDELQQVCKEHHIADVFIDDIIKEVDQDNATGFLHWANSNHWC